MSAADGNTGTNPAKLDECCPDCGHAWRYARPQRDGKTALCYFPTQMFDGPDCRCTRPRPSGEDA